MSRTRTTRGFKPKTVHEFNPEELFDEDIRGLHKLVIPAQILQKKVRYLKPSLPQVPYMINFMIEGFRDLVMSDEEAGKLTRNEIFVEVIKFVSETTEGLQSENVAEIEEANSILGSAFGSEAAIRYLIPVLQQCFPDLTVYKLTNDAFIDCFNLIFTDMFGQNEEEQTS